MVVQRGCNFGSLTQRGYLLVGVCRETGGLWTENTSSAELSPCLSEPGSPGHYGRWRGYLVGKEHGRGKRRNPRCQGQEFHKGCLRGCGL